MRTSSISQRYHGEASDIRFVRSVKQALHTTSHSGGLENVEDDEGVQSYEQDVSMHQEASDLEEGFPPSQDASSTYLNIYLSTIHIAYPFIERSELIRHHAEFWKSDSVADVAGPWLSILSEVLASHLGLMLMRQ